jgi:hypothetical protein
VRRLVILALLLGGGPAVLGLAGCATEGRLKDRIDVPLGPWCKVDTEKVQMKCERRF